MPTKDQLYRMWETEFEFPETRRLDDPMYSKPKIKNKMSEQKTLDEARVRTSFNPSDNSTVQHVKERAAEFINYVNDNVGKDIVTGSPEADKEFGRLKSLALTAIEEAAMWAVKAATFSC